MALEFGVDAIASTTAGIAPRSKIARYYHHFINPMRIKRAREEVSRSKMSERDEKGGPYRPVLNGGGGIEVGDMSKLGMGRCAGITPSPIMFDEYPEIHRKAKKG